MWHKRNTPEQMLAAHNRGEHKSQPRQTCEACYQQAKRDRAISRLHNFGCPVPMWEMVGKTYGHPKPACTCGAQS
jgi:hypothetical protein